MARPLVVGNGNLLVTQDPTLTLRDLYWPYVGLFNHLSGNRARLGIWVEGAFRWLDAPDWRRTLTYVPQTLVTNATATCDALGVTLTVNDAVLHRDDALLRRIRIINHSGRPREFRVFLTHDFVLAETDIGDTAFFNPFLDAIVHYKRDHYLLLAARGPEGGIAQYATGIKGFGGAEGTWRDAEDGVLSMNPVAQGSVDSAMGVTATIGAGESSEVRAWICVGHDLGAVTKLHYHVINAGFDALMHDTSHYWVSWSAAGADRVAHLPSPIPEVFRRSLLTIRTNTDNRGAIIAANDSDIMETARAHYSYMWPRDGALVASALDRLGYQDITRRFFTFCRDILPRDRAALLHKYSADRSWGATWHPWTIDGHHEIPFQEDGSALALWALWQHFERYRDVEFIESVYEDFVLPCARFIQYYRDPVTGLPLPSYDLWEERRGVHAYTCGTVYGALMAAANLSDIFDDGYASELRAAAAEVQAGIVAHLWQPAAGRFARQLVPTRPTGAPYEPDLTMDSAIHGLTAFGALAPNDPMVVSSMRSMLSRLWVQTEVGGIARYEGDYYFRQSDDNDRIPGNPWFICTLWAARWYIAQAATERDLVTPLGLLMWAASRTLQSGIMPEQLHPFTGEPLSVAPLTWSHAEFVSAVLDYTDRERELRAAH